MTEDRSLWLIGITGIRIGAELLSLVTLKADAINWRGKVQFPGIRPELTDQQLLRQLLVDRIPLTLIANTPLVLRAELGRFPYSIDGNSTFQAFALRLSPELGKISHFVVRDHPSWLAIEEIFEKTGLYEFDVGNGSLRLQIYLEPVDPSQLPPLEPCSGFLAERSTPLDTFTI